MSPTTQDVLSKLYLGLLTAVLSAVITLGAGMLVWREQFVRLVVIVEKLEEKLTSHDLDGKSLREFNERRFEDVNKKFLDIERRLDNLESRLSVRK